jgi:4-amino-4-deoxy-L-arabinose transferase-like glycosyltransferase
VKRRDRVEETASRLQRPLCCGFFLAGCTAVVYAQFQWAEHLLEKGLPWILLGILLVAVAALFRPLRLGGQPTVGQPRLGAAEIGFAAALTLAGGAVRLLGLDHAPPGGFLDEVQNALVAEDILKGNRPIFIAGATQMPALFFYFLAAAIAVAGKSVATVRGLAALFGTLTLPAFYFLARKAFSRPVAMAISILLAGSRWHITFSRWGFVTSMGPLLEVLAGLLLWRAAEGARGQDYALLGLVAGVGLQTYYSFNLFPAVLAIAALSYARREGWDRFWPELARIVKGLVWSVLVAGVLLVPVVLFAARNPEVFFERANTVAIWNPAHHLPWPGALWQNIAKHLLMFNFRGDWNPRHNIPDAPLLNPIEGVLMAIGLGLAIARVLKWPQGVWLTWFAVMLLPAIVTIEAPQAHRAVGAIPAVYLLLGEGLQGLYSLATVGATTLRTVLVATLVVVVSVASASQDVWRYFQVQVRDPLAWPAFQAEYHSIAQYIEPFGRNYDIWISALYNDPILRFHLGGNFPYQPFRLSEHLPAEAARLSPQSTGNLYVL